MGRMIGKYELGETLGRGNFSKVKVGYDREDGSKWAIKIIDRKLLEQEKTMRHIKREVAVMRRLNNHKNIVQLREVMQTPNNIYLVLELVTGGELFNEIVKSKRLDEPTARRYFHQLIAGLYYCHKKGFAHRDLKPENLLLDENRTLKITDFGLSNLMPSINGNYALMHTMCGTPTYVAPEVLRDGGYNGHIADIWSCGVVLYVMIAGYLPFDAETMNGLFLKIERGDYRRLRTGSNEVRDLIAQMLTVDPQKRITLGKIMAHTWFQIDWDASMLKGATDSLNSTVSNRASEGTVISNNSVNSVIQNEVDAYEPMPVGDPSALKDSITGDYTTSLWDFWPVGANADQGIVFGPNAPMKHSASHFFFRGTIFDVQQALEQLGSHPVMKDPATLEGQIESKSCLLSYKVIVSKTKKPGVMSADISKHCDNDEYRSSFYDGLCRVMGDKMSAESDKTDRASSTSSLNTMYSY
ncbi:putative serine/threonine protein kinase, putative,protein kinase [Trypanosoma grayi]|uniref:putative serine/threonine protein kinase, putative,protein kinase n=1 Tax=Trypanosoma grayi TaxID=71804 RepID=UPI0004F47532|nr:putative serine/threonine protein kinase, putative,protein kinase [Trypanosoma grayi]KEG08979.1 putative serine/threonine protein kinase, putative,protein kinase [Trypanosoma grayi]